MKKRNCIFCSLSSFDTGMPISTYKLAAGLAERGEYDVYAVLPEEGELADRMRGAGVSVEVISFRRLRSGAAALAKFIITYIIAGCRLYKFIRDNDIDIVHFSDVIDAPFYPVAKLAGAKTVGHVRVCAIGAAGRFLFRMWASLFCDRVIVISNFVKRYYGFGGKRAGVVYNPGPDRELFDSGRSESTSNPTVIAVAMFRRDKGIHNFIEIAARVRGRSSHSVNFVIVGGVVAGHEEYYDEMMEEVARKGLGECLTVTGKIPHEQVPLIMSQAAVLLHVPDWEEALGGVILEAMAMGVVPVAYDCGGVGECFTDGVSGFLVKRDDFDTAVDKVISIIGSPELKQKMARAAREELDAKFTLDKYIDGALKVYDDAQ